MGRSVDERVVEMRFDNQQFEQGVHKTIGTLDRLKQSLNLNGAAKGLENIDQAARNVSFDGIASGVESLEKRFSTFGIAGMRVVQNLTDSVMGFAKKTIGFVTDGIISGGKRRAMNIENAHFQLQGLLKDEKKVQAVMDDAMNSVDGTAYAYDEAAKAASQFAASGMEAGENMQSALRGITGVAAMTNSEYEDISRIFTTVAGNGRLMGDQLLQLSSRGFNAAATLAEYMTKVGNGAKVTEAEVRDMVSKGQVSFELFSAAMDDAFGEHAKRANETFTGAMANVKASLARIGEVFFSPLIVQNGPLVKFFNTLRERINDVKENIGPLAELFTDSVIGMANAATKHLEKLDLKKYLKGIADFVKKIREFAAVFKLSEEGSKNLKSTFQGLFAVLDLVRLAIGSVIRVLSPMTGGIRRLGSAILMVTGKIGEWLVSLNQAVKKSSTLGGILEKVGGIVGFVGDHIAKASVAFKDFVQGNLSDAAESRLTPFQKACETLKTVLSGLKEVLEEVAPDLAKLGGIVTDTLKKFGDGLSRAFHGDGFGSLSDLLNGGLMVGIGTGILNFIGHLQKSVMKASGMFSNVNSILTNVKTTLISYQAALKADVLMKIAKAIAILAASLLVLSLIDSEKLGGSLAAISVLFGELSAAMAIFNKTLGGGNITKLMASGSTMVAFSTAVLLLSFALKKIADIDSKQLIGALGGITALIVELVAASLVLSKWGGKMKTSALGMILISEAVLILSKAVGKLAELNTEELKLGLIGVASLLGELAAFLILAKFGGLKVTQGLAIIEIAAALLILEKAVNGFAKMKFEEMKQGLLGVAGALAMITLAMKFMPKNLVGVGLGLIGVAAALKIIASVIQQFGVMEWDEIGKSMTVLAGSMIILSVALNAMNGTLGGAAAMLVLSAALAVLTPCLKALGSMSLAEIGKAILMLGSAFMMFGLAGAVLGPIVPVILGLSAALALFGVAVAACGVGVLALSAGLTALAVSGMAGVTALVASMEILFVGILNVIIHSRKTMIEAIKTLVLSVVAVVVECAPAIVEGVLALVEEILKSLAVHTPNIVAYLMEFLIGLLNGVAERLPELIQAGANLIGAFFKGVIDVLKGMDTSALMEGIAGIGLLSAMMLALSLVAALIPSAMVGVLGMGAVIAELALVLAAIGAFAQLPGLEWLISEGGDLLQEIGTAIGKFVGGIAGGFLSGVSSQFPQIAKDLSDFMSNLGPFIEGASKIDANTMNGVKALAETILILTAADILEGLTSWFTGGSSLAAFGEELCEFGPLLAEYADAVKNITPESVEGSAAAAKMLADMASTLPNTGGLAAEIFGDNTLSQFGRELVAFGPYLAQYARDVAGITPESVIGSAAAGKILSELAKAVPATKGLKQFFTGNKDLGTFGGSLKTFGESLKKYYNEVKDIKNPEIISLSAKAAKSLTQLDGVKSGDIVSFGTALKSFGSSLASYYSEISEIDVSKLGGVTGELKKLANTSSSGMVTSFADGVKKKKGTVVKSFTEMIKESLDGIRKKKGNFKTEGSDIMKRFAAGIKTGKETVKTLISGNLDSALTNIRKKYEDFYSAGSYLVEGFTKGIKDNISKAAAQAKAMGDSATEAANKALKVNSPSKVFMEIGKYVVDGFANGIDRTKAKAGKSAAGLALVGVQAAAEVAKSLKSGDSVFSDFVEKTDENGKAVKITLEKAAEAFKSFRDSIKESVKGATGVFDAFEVNVEASGEQLLKNLASQITGIAEWAANIQLLAKRGIDKGLLKVLSDMGPSGAGYVRALVTMSDKELKKLNQLYQKRMGLNDKTADEIAASFLNGGEKAAKAYEKGVGKSGEGTFVALARTADAAKEKVKEDLSKISSWNYTDAVKGMKASLDYGKGAFQQFVNEYLKTTDNMKLGDNAIKAASKAISAYGQKLYEESEYYKEDTANLNTHKKELKDLENERKKLQKELNKAQKSNTKNSKKRVKTLKEELDANDQAISVAKENIKKDEKEIAKHTKEVFNDLRATLSDSVSTFLDPLRVSLESGVDLFKKFESSSDLYETDKKNLESHKKSLKELEETQKKIQDEMAKYANQNTLAARLRLKELKKQLSEVENSIEETKKNIEQTEKDMESHSGVTVDKILENMQSQVQGVRKWQQNLKKLAGRGLSEGLLEKLKSMGADGVDYVDQFLKMTTEEMKKANDLFAQSENLTSQTLLDNFKDSLNTAKDWADGLQKMAKMGFGQDLLEKLGAMGVDGYDYVRAFLSMTPAQVAEFNKEFADSLKLPDKIADQVLSSYAYVGGQSVAGFTSALAKLSESGSEENKLLVELSDSIGLVMETSLRASSQTSGKKSMEALAKGMESKKGMAKGSSKEVATAALKEMKGVLSDKSGKKVAGNLVDGLNNGLKSGSSSVSKMARQVAEKAYRAAKDTLGIKSPSRKFAELGRYVDLGFMKGLMAEKKGVFKTATDIMGQAIQEVSDRMDSELDTQPTIKPVLDLTEIQNGVGRMDKMLDDSAISGSVDLARVTANAVSGRTVQGDDATCNAIQKLQDTLTDLLNRPGIEQHNTFSITGGDPKEIADEVSYILQRQIERRGATWA